jgi:hypothetical protein
MTAQWNEVVNTRLPQHGLTANQHIRNITIESIAGTNVAVIDMSELGWYGLSTYIGILSDEELGLYIFSLERALVVNGSPRYRFEATELSNDSSVVNRQIGNNRQAFLSAIAETINELR